MDMDDEEKVDHIRTYWHKVIAKSLGAVQVINTFGDLNRRLFLYGSTKKNHFETDFE